MSFFALSATMGVGAILALVGVYGYAALALTTHAHLGARAPPASIGGSLAAGMMMPACGCTALTFARRIGAPLRAIFLISAYAVNPLVIFAALFVAALKAALAVIVLGALAALVAHLIAPTPTATPALRLTDLLLKRDGSPIADAPAYVMAFVWPTVAAGAVLGAVAWGAFPPLSALAVGGLALWLGPPHAEVATDHGAPFAERLREVHWAFAAAVGAAAGVLT